MPLQDLLRECRKRTEATLDQWLPAATEIPEQLHDAMRYAALDGGKRIRPALVYLTGRALGVPETALDGPACAVELIHVYSLVHDDLPAMDDDALRRGKPTCHKAYDEATAILAGDGLQALAFEVLSRDPNIVVSPARRLEMIGYLAQAAGTPGMVGGQAIDMAASGRNVGLEALKTMHAKKTGALIRAAVRLGGLSAAGAGEDLLARLDRYAAGVGLSFQIRDDILDVEGTTEALGKTRGSDAAHHKATYTSLLGLDAAKRLAREAMAEAVGELDSLGDAAAPLRELAEYIIERAS